LQKLTSTGKLQGNNYGYFRNAKVVALNDCTDPETGFKPEN